MLRKKPNKSAELMALEWGDLVISKDDDELNGRVGLLMDSTLLDTHNFSRYLYVVALGDSMTMAYQIDRKDLILVGPRKYFPGPSVTTLSADRQPGSYLFNYMVAYQVGASRTRL